MTVLNNLSSSIATPIFSPEDVALLDKNRIPNHIAIIPDGNRRWAKEKNTSSESGHREGADTIMDIVKAGKELGIKVITFYLFSTENWARPQEEVAALMWLLQSYLIEQKQLMIDEGISLQTIGDLTRFHPLVLDTILETKAATEACDKIEMVFALNYGGRDDIRRAIQKVGRDLAKGLIQEADVTESLISRYLDTAHWKDPDLLIRTSGEIRISNFLLWQISYAEIFVTQTLWPNFTSRHLLEALIDFQKRQRRHGGT